jgi:hypothetical protein
VNRPFCSLWQFQLRLVDCIVEGRMSGTLPPCTYKLHEWLLRSRDKFTRLLPIWRRAQEKNL